MMNTRKRLLPLVSAVLLGLAVGGGGCARHGGQSGPGASPTPAAPPSSAASTAPSTGTPGTQPPSGSGTWRQIARAPVATSQYYDFVSVWTGTRLLIHEVDYTAGRGSVDAAYDPASGAWQKLPSSPFPVRPVEGGTQAVWDGTEMLTFGTLNAAYNPATRQWRRLAASPMAGPSAVVWTGSRVLMWGGGCCDDETNVGASYNPVTDRWTALPAAPLAPRHADGVWTGREMIVVGGEAHGETFYADAAAYNPATGKWRKLPSLPGPRMAATLTWTGQDLLVVGGEKAYGGVPYTTGYAYRPSTDRWRPLPAMPAGRSAHVAVWTGSRLIVWGGYTRAKVNATPTRPEHGLMLDPAGGDWTALPTAPIVGRRDAAAFWTGGHVLVWGGYAVGEPSTAYLDGALYRMP